MIIRKSFLPIILFSFFVSQNCLVCHPGGVDLNEIVAALVQKAVQNNNSQPSEQGGGSSFVWLLVKIGLLAGGSSIVYNAVRVGNKTFSDICGGFVDRFFPKKNKNIKKKIDNLQKQSVDKFEDLLLQSEKLVQEQQKTSNAIRQLGDTINANIHEFKKQSLENDNKLIDGQTEIKDGIKTLNNKINFLIGVSLFSRILKQKVKLPSAPRQIGNGG